MIDQILVSDPLLSLEDTLWCIQHLPSVIPTSLSGGDTYDASSHVVGSGLCGRGHGCGCVTGGVGYGCGQTSLGFCYCNFCGRTNHTEDKC